MNWLVHFEWLSVTPFERVAILRLFNPPVGEIAPDGQPIKAFVWTCVVKIKGRTAELKAALTAPPVPGRLAMKLALKREGVSEFKWDRWKGREVRKKTFSECSSGFSPA